MTPTQYMAYQFTEHLLCCILIKLIDLCGLKTITSGATKTRVGFLNRWKVVCVEPAAGLQLVEIMFKWFIECSYTFWSNSLTPKVSNKTKPVFLVFRLWKRDASCKDPRSSTLCLATLTTHLSCVCHCGFMSLLITASCANKENHHCSFTWTPHLPGLSLSTLFRQYQRRVYIFYLKKKYRLFYFSMYCFNMQYKHYALCPTPIPAISYAQADATNLVYKSKR